MCYAIPGKVAAINNRMVTVDYFGEKKRAINDLQELSIGDYIYAQGGYVISKISATEAKKILSTWKELFFKLQELDRKSAHFIPVSNRTVSIYNKVNKGFSPTGEDLRYLLGLKDKAELEIFFKAANALRQKYHKNSCCVHGIIEISNYCRRGCHYCGISRLNTKLKRYRMSKDEILTAVKDAVEKYGFKALVLQSGEDDGYTLDTLIDIVKTIKQRYAVLIFISFGEIGKVGLEELYRVGARGLLMRFETSNRGIYRKLHPGSSLENRLEEIRFARHLGYLIVTGGLIGLPGQSRDDIINDVLLAKELKAEMFSFGPFLPHPNTPLANNPAPCEEDVLKTLALVRFVAPKEAKILVTTGFETLSAAARQKGLVSGASSVMLNATPLKYRNLYSIYPQRAHEKEKIEFQIKEAIALLKSLGRAPTDLGTGD